MRPNRTHVEAEEPRYTLWHNPTMQDQVVSLFDHDNRPIKYTLKPNERKHIPSHFDNAIHMLAKDGRTILGGMAPLLVRVDSDEVLSDGCNVDLQARKAAEAQAAAAMLSKQVADMTMLKAAEAMKVVSPPAASGSSAGAGKK